jgi:two-component system sensor histidine kinase CpxA
VFDAARLATQTSDQKIIKDWFPQVAVERIRSERGESYVWVVEVTHHRSFVFEHLLLLGSMMLTGAIFCYWLARYLTAPVKKLRAATNEVARGNLATRVVPSLGGRRDELASLGADFDAMAEQIEALLKAQRRLLGDISHELRSPLARLNVALELARQRSGPAATTALERIEHEAQSLNKMIGQLLALTRVESGTREISKANVNLTKLVQSIAADCDFEARSRKRSVRIAPSEDCVISGSEELLRPAIENVIRNAIQYTAEESEVEVEIRKSSSSVQTNGDGERRSAEVTVRDHGKGLPENELGEIFRAFYRVDDARDRESGGTGLGLAITERAIQLHGGTVAAMNAVGGGLIVRISLPIKS